MGNRHFPAARLSGYRGGMKLRETAFAVAVVRQFTPNFFTVTMGTGIVMLDLLALLPGHPALAAGLWLADTALYALFAVLFTARLILFPETVEPMLRHPTMSMFLGAIPMGLVPVVNGCVLIGAGLFGPGMIAAAHVLWWADAALAVGVALIVPYRLFVHQQHTLDRITPLWLLPIVGPEVTASGGAVLAPHLPPELAQQVVGASYLLWSMSVPFAFSIITLVVLRYALHKLPEAGMAASIWLILGPIGTGSLGMVALGQAAPAAFAGGPLVAAAEAARTTGLFCGLVLWGMGIWWLLIACAATARYVRQGIPFNLGWWGYTFPLGVYTAATLELAKTTGHPAFLVAGRALFVLLAAAWIVVAFHTARSLLRRRLLYAPCLAKTETEPAWVPSL